MRTVLRPGGKGSSPQNEYNIPSRKCIKCSVNQNKTALKASDKSNGKLLGREKKKREKKENTLGVVSPEEVL